MESFIAPPTGEHISLAKSAVIILSLFFIPYISVILGSTVFSLGFYIRGKTEENTLFTRIGKDLANTFLGNLKIGAVLGILPVFTLMICYSQILYGTDIHITQYLAVTLLLVSCGILLSWGFRSCLENEELDFNLKVLSGGITLVVLLLAVFSFVSSVTLINYPERWPIITTLIPVTYEWNAIARFLHFVMAALTLTGIAILFFFSRKEDEKQQLDEPYQHYIKKFSSGVALAFTVIQTLFFLWNTITLPIMAKSEKLYAMAILVVVVLCFLANSLYAIFLNAKSQAVTGIFAVFMFIVSALLTAYRVINLGEFLIGVVLVLAYLIYTSLTSSKRKHAYTGEVFVMSLVLFLVVLINENIARENALEYQNFKLEKISQDHQDQIKQARASIEGKILGGEALMQSKLCASCHSIDGAPSVGPTFKGLFGKTEIVLVDGQERSIQVDEAYLKRAIADPGAEIVKGFQNAMPPQTLTDEEMAELINYIKELK